MRAVLLPLTVAVSVAACTGGKSDPPLIIPGPDASIDAPKPCGASASYGTPTPSMELAFRDLDVNPTELYYDAALNADPKFDDLSLQLFKGIGAFAAGELGPTTVLLTADEANYETCGACALIYVDLDPDNDYLDDGVYMAAGGTLNITSITPNLTGTLINANFVHVTIDEDTFRSTPVGDCSASVMSFAFDFPVMTDTGMAFTSRGKPRLRKPAR